MEFCIKLCFVDGSSTVLGTAKANSLIELATKLKLGERALVNRTETCGRFEIPSEKSELKGCLWIEEVEQISSKESLLGALEVCRLLKEIAP